MVMKEVPGWARKCLLTGLLLPLVCFFLLKDYSNNLGFFGNLMYQNVEIPLLWGQNPLACMRQDAQLMIQGSIGLSDPVRTAGCQFNTLVAYRHVLGFSLLLVALGLYMYVRGNQVANLWPTDWKVFDEKNVRHKDGGSPNGLNGDKHISPRDGGF